MAYVQMSAQYMDGTPTTWGSSPSITVSGYVIAYRDDSTNNAKIRLTFTVNPVTGSSYFGYTITGNCWVINSSYLKSVALKSASQSQWSSALTATVEWELGNISSSTSILIAQEFATNSSRGSKHLSMSITIPDYVVTPTYTNGLYYCIGGLWTKTIPYIGRHGQWIKCDPYVGVNGEWKLS